MGILLSKNYCSRIMARRIFFFFAIIYVTKTTRKKYKKGINSSNYLIESSFDCALRLTSWKSIFLPWNLFFFFCYEIFIYCTGSTQQLKIVNYLVLMHVRACLCEREFEAQLTRLGNHNTKCYFCFVGALARDYK